MAGILEKINEIRVEREDEIILRQIQQLIHDGELKPGDKLPSERSLAERFNVGRGYVRLAIQKMEMYGLVKTFPQSGSIISELGITLFDDFLKNLLAMQDLPGESLLETRRIIELETAQLAAKRGTEENIGRLLEAYYNHRNKVENGFDGMEEDVLFHLRIAECAENLVLRSLIMVIANDVVSQSRGKDECSGNRKIEAADEHKMILDAIKNHDPHAASAAMTYHLINTGIVDKESP